MEPILNKKRHIALFIPYKKTNTGNQFYLQMRDEHAPTNANIFSIFGGGIDDGETADEALLREIREELEYMPLNVKYFMHSDTGTRTCEVYIEEVGPDFESKVNVREGKYGKFLANDEIVHAKDVSYLAKILTAEINAWLHNIAL